MRQAEQHATGTGVVWRSALVARPAGQGRVMDSLLAPIIDHKRFDQKLAATVGLVGEEVV